MKNSIYFDEVEVGDFMTFDFLYVFYSHKSMTKYYIDLNNHVIYSKRDGDIAIRPVGEWRMHDETEM